MKKEEQKYVYPAGDFLSGFSEDETNPCDYELECQRLVTRGVEYLDKNEDLFNLISLNKVKVSDKEVQPMIDFMCCNPDSSEEESFGQTGAMVEHTVKHAYYAKKMGWDNYIQKITSKE
jgi:hypothetical protein